MTKITLANVGSLIDATTAANTINANNAIIQAAFDNTLSRDGTTPNQILSSVDANSHQILNLPTPATANSPLRLQDLTSFIGGGTISNIPPGGTTGQVLAKSSNVDYNTGWTNSVTSVGLTLPADLTVTNSPVTTSGTLTGAWATTPTGTGAMVRATSPTLVTPVLGTPASGVATNLTGTAAGLTAGNVTTNANLTGPITSTGNATSVASQTGTGSTFVMNTSPTLVSPSLGVASATTLNGITIQPSSGTLVLNTNTLGVPGSGVTLQLQGTGTTTQTFPSTSGTVVSSVTSAGGSLTGTYPSPTIAANAVTNAMYATMPANTIKGNVTGSAAVPTDFTIDGLPAKASPVAADEIIIWDVAGAAIKKATVSSIASAGAVATFNGQTGTIVSYFHPQGRLTLTTGVPVMTTSVAAATTVYYTPYAGDMVPIYNGTNMVPTATVEISQATTDATKSPAACTTNSNYDIFVWNDSGTIRATRGPAWTSGTARGTGAGTSQLVLQNGIYLNNNAITNGPGASRGTYVGTIRTNGSSQVDFIFGGTGVGGVAASLGLWNAYNRVNASTTVADSTGSWTYAVATTWRAADASNTNRVSLIRGLDEDSIMATYNAGGLAGSGAVMVAGIGIDSTSAFSGVPGFSTITTLQSSVGTYCSTPGLGFHFIQAIELNSNTTSSTWFGSFNGYLQNGLTVTTRL